MKRKIMHPDADTASADADAVDDDDRGNEEDEREFSLQLDSLLPHIRVRVQSDMRLRQRVSSGFRILGRSSFHSSCLRTSSLAFKGF